MHATNKFSRIKFSCRLACCLSQNDNNSNFIFVVALFTGKMFKSAELIYPIAFFQMFYNDKPVDWLLEHLIYTKVCNWEKDMVREKEILNQAATHT